MSTDPDLVTNTGTRLACSDCAKLTKRIEELELENKQLKEYVKQSDVLVQKLKEQLESKTVEELSKYLSEFKLYSQVVGSQQKKNENIALLTSSNQTEPLAEEQPLHAPVNRQPEDCSINGEMALPGKGQMEKPGILSSLQTQATPTQVTPSQGNTAVAVSTTTMAAASVSSPENGQVSCRGDHQAIIRKTEMITDEMIMFIKGKLPKYWKDFARTLKLKAEVIEEIDVNFGHIGNVLEAVHQMLVKWRQSNGKDATTDSLLEALEKMERKDLVDEFCDEFKLFSSSSESDKPYAEQNDSVVPETRLLQEQHQQSVKHQSEPVQSNFEKFFSDFMLDSTAAGKKEFRKDLNRLNNFKGEETKSIASEMEWNPDKLDSEVNENFKVYNVLDKWAGILLIENPLITKVMKRSKIQEMVRSLRSGNGSREDVISEIRNHLLVGTVGTKVKPTTQYTELSYSIRLKVASELTLLGEKCSLVAEGLGIENSSIRYLINKHDRGQQVLRSWETKANATVGTLYNVLIDHDACTVASMLE